MNVVQSALSSRRFNRWLLWLAVGVFVVGVIAVMIAFFGNTAKVEDKTARGPVIPAAIPQKNIPFPEDAWRVAREFVFTAIARKNLAEAWAITHPSLRSGVSRKEWNAGNLPVVYSPAGQIKKWNWKNTNYAHPRDAQINVIIIPKDKRQRTFYAQIGLVKVGKASKAHWLVNYFSPLSGPPVPTPK